MINVSAATIMTAHYNANNYRSICCHSAQPGIASHKLSHAFSVISLSNLHTFDPLPELKCPVVIVDPKFTRVNPVPHRLLRAYTRFINIIPSEVEAATQPRELSRRGQAFRQAAQRKGNLAGSLDFARHDTHVYEIGATVI
jgi:hypothetical protein